MDRPLRLDERAHAATAYSAVNELEFGATYPLTPMQGGMLFHHLYQPATDVYFGQAHWSIQGPLDVSAFHASWQQVVQRHSILRTSFDWAGSSGPVQRVHRQAAVPLECLDWRDRSAEQQRGDFDAFLGTDRARGFNLAVPPLLRITVIRLGEDVYRVVWSGHHLLVDGRSINLIVREVMALYTARIEGTPIALPIPVPYADFVSWLDGRDLAGSETFWRRSLQGFTAPTSVSLHHPTSLTSATESEGVRVPAELLVQLRSLARASEVSLNTVIMGAWSVLTGRYSRSDDVVFGITIGSGGKGAPLSRSLAGLLINTLPLRVFLRPEDSTAALLHQIRRSMLGLKRHAHSSLVDVARWSEMPADLPLFDTILVFDNSAIDRLARRYGALQLGRLTIEQHSSYPFNLVVQPGQELALKFIYTPGYLPKDAIQRLGRQLEHVLCTMATDPGSMPATMCVLPAAEAEAVLIDWNDTTVLREPGITLDRLFDQQVRRSPGAVALECGGERLTYAQLDRRATALAERLHAYRAGPEVIVGIALERSIELVVAMVAIARVGAACLFLDTQLPERRLAFMVNDAGARVCLTTRTLRPRLPAHQRVLLVDEPPSGFGRAAPDPVDVADHHLAYVIYTSGTTGQPKAVVIEHRNLVNLVAWHVRTFRLTAAVRTTQLAGLGFDALVWEIWPTLACGATLCVPPDDVRRVPRRLQAWLQEQHITSAFVPTPLAEALLALSWPPDSALRTMLVGGDVLRVWPDAAVPFEVVNNYGPSECTVVSTSGTIHPGLEARGHLPPIGRPIDNVETYVLDEARQPVPIGVPGELYIGGAGVGRGYLNQPELTARRFIPHPFTRAAGARLYRTGDLARFRADGTIEFLGRLDDQIQLRGYRIEPAEIEAVLRDHPEIRDAVVAARADGAGRTQLVAYLVSARDGLPDSTALREHLRRTVPEYMLPSAFVPVDAIPLSPNGKVDRAALPAPVPPSTAPVHDAALPLSPVQESLVAAFKATLRLDTVTVGDNFFELGGNSLLAIELLERIRLGLGTEIALSDLFRTPTAAGLAELCSRGSASPTAGVLVPIQPLGSRPPFFCAAPVLGTVFPYYELAHAMSPDQPFYGLQPVQGPHGSGATWTIEAIARRYLEAVRRVQPSGPYSLGGWSFGGLVAFEMAQQLERAGESVSQLIMLDTPAPGLQHYLRAHQSLRVFGQTVLGGLWDYARDYEYLATGSQRGSPSHSAHRLQRLYQLGKSFGDRAAIARVVPRESRLLLYHLPTLREMARLFVTGLAATLRYRPSTYPGRVTLLRTAEHHAEGAHSAFLGWDTVSREDVSVLPIPGNHLTLLRQPHLEVVARTLQAVLDSPHGHPDDRPMALSAPAYAAGQ